MTFASLVADLTGTAVDVSPGRARPIDQARAEQAGCLLRPRRLLAARRVHAEGRLSEEALRALEDRAILDSLRVQRAAGLHVFTDGQFRRRDPIAADAGDAGTHVRGDSVHTRVAPGEAGFLRTHAPGWFKVAVPSPSSLVLQRIRPAELDVRRLRALLARASAALRTELSLLVAEGAPYVQLDLSAYASLARPRARAAWQADRTDPDAVLAEAVDADNACLGGLPRHAVTVGMHLCPADTPGDWLGTPELAPLTSELLRTLDYDRLLVECDPRSTASLEALRRVPKRRQVVLGVVDPEGPQLPSYDQVLSRITEAARHVAFEDLAIGPGCRATPHRATAAFGFEDERRVLELVGRVARDVWSRTRID